MKYAFIVGGPKCGTSTLAHWLGRHPDVCVSSPKEPHFFANDLNIIKPESEVDYLKGFSVCKDGRQLCVDASTWYLASANAVPNIEKWTNGGARYIVMTRNPSDMVVSLYYHLVRHGVERCPDLEDAWGSQERRRTEPNFLNSAREPRALQYLWACSTYSHCQRLMRKVDLSRVFHVPMDWLIDCPADVWEGLQEFLELEYVALTDYASKNVAARPAPRIVRLMLPLVRYAKIKLGIRKSYGLLGVFEGQKQKNYCRDEFRALLDEVFSAERAGLQTLPRGTMSSPRV